MRIVADESLDYGIIKELRKNGYNVLAIEDLMKGAEDDQVLKFSLKENSILITEDKDFGELVYRLNKAHIGIILVRLSGLELENKNRIVLKSLNDNILEMKNAFSVIMYWFAGKWNFQNLIYVDHDAKFLILILLFLASFNLFCLTLSFSSTFPFR